MKWVAVLGVIVLGAAMLRDGHTVAGGWMIAAALACLLFSI